MRDNIQLLRLAFWLGCFAMLMMHLGPLVSGVQGVLAEQEPVSFTQIISPGDAQAVDDNSHAAHSHAEHHALMGHMINPHLPDWVNNLKMCGYCELLTLSPALVLALFLALAMVAPRPFSIFWTVLDVYSPRLQAHAAPRAPPFFA